MNHEIPLATAVEMTTRYRNNRKTVLAPSQNPDLLPICETFEKAAIQQLLDEPRCVNFRIYYGMDDKLNIHAILVGADADGNDILPAVNTTTGEDPVVILEDSVRCPNICPPASVLNGE